jgi:hypothetical protein
MNATLNLAIVVAGPIVILGVIAIVRWLMDRDSRALGRRLRSWGFWGAIGTYAVIGSAMSLSMAVNSEDDVLAGTLTAAALFAGLPLGTWAWQRAGGRGLPIAVCVAVAGLCALALAVMVAPQFWRDVQEGGFPLVSVVALAIGASAAVWGRTAPIPAGAALLVAGVVPLGTAVVASAAADVVLVEMFAPMPMFAVLGLAYLAAARLDGSAAHRESVSAAPAGDQGRTMTG